MTYVDQEPDTSPPEPAPPPPQPAFGPPPSPLRKVALQTQGPTPPDTTPPQTAPPGPSPPTETTGPQPAAAQFPPSPVAPGQLAQQWSYPREFQSYAPPERVNRANRREIPWQEKAIYSYPDLGSSSLAPSPPEAYRRIHETGSWLGQYGSPAVSGPAMAAGRIANSLGGFMDMLSGGGRTPFTSAFNRMEGQSLAKQRFALQAQREFMEMRRQEMLDYQDMAVNAQRKQMMEADDAFQEYEHGIIDEKELERRIDDWARRTGHQTVAAALHNSGVKSAEDYLERETAKINTLSLSGHSLRASDQRRRDAAAAKNEPTDLDREWTPGAGQAGGDRPQFPRRGEEGTQADATAEEGYDALSDGDKEIARKHNLTPSAVTAAHQIYNEGTAGGLVPSQMRLAAKKKFGDVVSAAGDIDRRIKQAIAPTGNPEEDTPAQRIERIRDIDPVAATTLDGLRKYETNPDEPGKKNRARDAALARLVDPHYKPGFFKQAQKYKDPNTKEGSIIERTATLPGSALALLRALKPMKENDPNLKRVIEQINSSIWNGDPRYGEVHQAIRNYLTDVIGVQMGTGTPRVTLIAEGAKTMTATSSPAQLRQQMLVDLIPSFGMINQINRGWQRETQSNDNAPLYDEDNAKMIDAIVRMNGYTGEAPEDAPDELLAVSKKPTTGKDRPRWLTDDMARSPLTRKQVDYWRGWLEKNPKDPDAQAIREQLGIIPDLRPKYPNAR